MTTLISGASGHLGRLVIDAMITRGTDPSDVVAGARNKASIADVAERGVRTVELDFGRPETIAAALDGVETMLLVSLPNPASRLAHQLNAVDAAREAGIRKLVYTSAPQATTAEFVLSPDHKATEEAISAAGIPAVKVRNNWYTENYASQLAQAAETGQLVGSAGSGRVASANRSDYAEGIAVVLRDDGHLGHVYEFSGDTSWDFDEFAATVGELVGRDVKYTSLSTDDHIAMLESSGLDGGSAAFVAGIDTGIRNGVLADADPVLSHLIGRSTTPLIEGLRALR